MSAAGPEGRVYFAQAGTGGPIKIGWTRGDPRQRLADLQTGNPHRINLVATVPGTSADEAALHARFADARLEGEWFAPVAELRDHLRGLGCDLFGFVHVGRERWELELLILARRVAERVEGNRQIVTWIARCTADVERREPARERFCQDFAAFIGLLAEVP